jgi:hypothetical protein
MAITITKVSLHQNPTTNKTHTLIALAYAAMPKPPTTGGGGKKNCMWYNSRSGSSSLIIEPSSTATKVQINKQQTFTAC